MTDPIDDAVKESARHWIDQMQAWEARLEQLRAAAASSGVVDVVAAEAEGRRTSERDREPLARSAR